jgi:hypothetical protein
MGNFSVKMSIKELFVKRIPLLYTNDAVHNHVGLVLKSVIQRLNLGELIWDIYPIEKARCLIGVKEGDRDVDTTGLLKFMNKASALMARHLLEVNYKVKINGRMVDSIFKNNFLQNLLWLMVAES